MAERELRPRLVAIHFTWHKDPDGVAAVLPAIEERSRRSTLGRTGQGLRDRPGHRSRRLPAADDFRRLAKEMDPDGTFRNAFLDRFLPAV